MLKLCENLTPISPKHACAVLVPFFPADILAWDDLDSYKVVAYHDIRFNTILLSMVTEVAEVYSIEADKFLLAGFSGGGQLAQHFLYLHPGRLRAVSIGAPGSITLPDTELDWPKEIRNLLDVFGADFSAGPDYEAMGNVGVQFVVGELDNDRNSVAGPDGTGQIDRIGVLKTALAARGVGLGAPLDVVPGVAHSSAGARKTVQDFLAVQLLHVCNVGILYRSTRELPGGRLVLRLV